MTTTHELALLRLVAQRLVGPPLPTAADVVGHLLAVQAQDLPGATTSLALRAAPRSWEDAVAAFDSGAVVRSWPMRGTLHAVRAPDLGWMLRLMTARPRAAAASRRPQLGLGEDDVARAADVTSAALAGGRALVRAELMALWEEHGLATAGGRGYHLLSALAHDGLVCFGPVRDGDQAIVLLEEWVPRPRELGREEALAELARRFLHGHGPATAADLARWSGLPLRDVRAGIEAVRADLGSIEVDGVTYLLDPAVPDLLAQHRAEAAGTLLVPGFDELVLGYADRTATVPAAVADRIVPGGNGVFRATVVHDGVAVGTWRWVGSGARRRVEAEPFEAWPAGVEEGIRRAAERLPARV